MPMVSVDSEDLLALVRACKEYELDARAHRATWTSLRLAIDKPQLDLRYGNSYRAERERYAKTADWKYEPMFQAIAQGTPADLALKQVADRLRP
jgi:hypothetical protein